jgi:hypothetical protein
MIGLVERIFGMGIAVVTIAGQSGPPGRYCIIFECPESISQS